MASNLPDPGNRGLASVTSEKSVQFKDFCESDSPLHLSHPHLCLFLNTLGVAQKGPTWPIRPQFKDEVVTSKHSFGVPRQKHK